MLTCNFKIKARADRGQRSASGDITGTKIAPTSPVNPPKSGPRGRCTRFGKEAAPPPLSLICLFYFVPPPFVGRPVEGHPQSNSKATRNDVKGIPYVRWAARK
jgi:hypothetical protein